MFRKSTGEADGFWTWMWRMTFFSKAATVTLVAAVFVTNAGP